MGSRLSSSGGAATSLGSQVPNAPTRAGSAGSSASASRQDHAHVPAPGALWLPADYGVLGWTYDPYLASNTTTLVAGQAIALQIQVPSALSVTNIVLFLNNAGVTLTNAYAGLYSSAGVQLGVSADQSTAWSSSGQKTIALVGGPYSVSAGSCFVGLLIGTAGTMPSMPTVAATNSTLINLGLTVARCAAIAGGLSALPASFTPSSLSVTNKPIWAALS
jgi:hypothetical protein